MNTKKYQIRHSPLLERWIVVEVEPSSYEILRIVSQHLLFSEAYGRAWELNNA